MTTDQTNAERIRLLRKAGWTVDEITKTIGCRKCYVQAICYHSRIEPEDVRKEARKRLESFTCEERRMLEDIHEADGDGAAREVLVGVYGVRLVDHALGPVANPKESKPDFEPTPEDIAAGMARYREGHRTPAANPIVPESGVRRYSVTKRHNGGWIG